VSLFLNRNSSVALKLTFGVKTPLEVHAQNLHHENFGPKEIQLDAKRSASGLLEATSQSLSGGWVQSRRLPITQSQEDDATQSAEVVQDFD